MARTKKLDGGALLTEARVRAGLTQLRLATLAGVARSTVNAYEAGRRSPTVPQLNALLATCGMEARTELVELAPELEERIDAAMTAVPAVDDDQVARMSLAFDELGVTWAVDGSTALALQGLALGEGMAFVLVDDEHFRRFLYRRQIKGRNRFGEFGPIGMAESREDIQAAFGRGMVLGWGIGLFTLRLVEALPPVMVQVSLPDERVADVLSVADVLAAHPQWADVLAGVLRRRADEADGELSTARPRMPGMSR